MDLALYARVLLRHKPVVICGLVLAIALAVLTKMGSTVVWQSQRTVFVTQQGFPWGRAIVNVPTPGPASGKTNAWGPPSADPNRFISLAILYSHLANSDQVRKIMLKQGKIEGKYEAAPVPSDDGNGFIPFINVTAQANSAPAAVALAKRATDAFRGYLAREQTANGISDPNRVQLPVVSTKKPLVIAGKSITRPVFVFLLVMMATFGLALLLEKVRARRPETEAAEHAVNGTAPALSEVPEVLAASHSHS
jgi:hypothetical protein